MSVKTTGGEYKKFYHDDKFWPDDAWIDYEQIKVNGKDYSDDFGDPDGIPDDAEVEIVYGAVFLDKNGNKETDLVSYFKKWKREQTRVVIRIEVNKDDAEGIKEVLRRVKDLEIL